VLAAAVSATADDELAGPPAPRALLLPEAPRSEPGFKEHLRIAGIYAGPIALDMGATELLCARGCRELITGQSSRQRLAIAGLEIVALTYVDQGPLRNHPGWQRGLRIGAVVVRGAYAGLALAQLHRGR